LNIPRHPSRALIQGLECLLVALLVLCWGTQFKASLYQLASQTTPVPMAKLLSDIDRADTASHTVMAAPDATPQAAHFISYGAPALLSAIPDQDLARLGSLDLSNPNWQLIAQRASLGHFYHRPPPTL